MGFMGMAWDAAQAATLTVTVLDRDGKPVPDAVVVVTPSVRGTPKNRPPLSATIVQEKMQFIPAVTVVSVGSRLAGRRPWSGRGPR